MPLAYQDVPARLRQRCCLVCGYDGPELQGESGEETYRCPACDADLYARPPRSYAELEGFVAESEPAAPGGERALAEIKVRRGLPTWVSRLVGWLTGPRKRARG